MTATTASYEPTVTGYLSWDHDRLDALLEQATTLVRAGDLVAALAKYTDFAHGLRRHIRLEEEVLFPAFEQATGMVQGPTTVMRMEHREILDTLSDMQLSLAGKDAAGFEAARNDLLAVLQNHNVKEERILYPGTDRALGIDQRTALVHKLEHG